MSEADRVLIIEDDKAVSESMAELLSFEGYDTKVANNGKEGLEILKKGFAPCIILLDLMMPVMDGWTFHSQLKKEPAFLQIPVLVMSGVVDVYNHLGLDGIVGRVQKPINFEALMSLIRMHC